MKVSEDERLSYMALSQVEGVGPVIARNLIAYCGGINALFHAKASKLAQAPEVGSKLAEKIAQGISLTRAEVEWKYCQENNIQVLTFMDDCYPEYLKTIYQAPIILFAKGNIEAIASKCAIAVVGTRKPSSYGKKCVKDLVTFLSDKEVNIVSGLAYGIDHDAHQTALEQNGFTTAVIPNGFKNVYPAAHKSLLDKIAEKGLVLTEYFSDVHASKYVFPNRNRIISGLCRAVVVVESPLKGGSLITARLAFDQNREVYAIPANWGQKTGEGCNALIRDNIAKLLLEPKEILEDLSWEVNALEKTNKSNNSFSTVPLHELDEEERQIITVLQNGALVIDQIEDQTAIPVGKLLSLLITLEFKGWVESLPGKKYKRLI
jgi:DNA processing protein